MPIGVAVRADTFGKFSSGPTVRSERVPLAGTMTFNKICRGLSKQTPPQIRQYSIHCIDSNSNLLLEIPEERNRAASQGQLIRRDCGGAPAEILWKSYPAA